MLGASETNNRDKAPSVIQGQKPKGGIMELLQGSINKKNKQKKKKNRPTGSVIKQSGMFTLRVVLQSLIKAAALAQLTNVSTERTRSVNLSWPVLIRPGS